MNTHEAFSSTAAVRPSGLDALAQSLALPSGRDGEHLDLATARLAAFGLRGVRASLRSLLSDPAALSVVASRSYRHGNGFLKIVLHRSRALSLRLHIQDGSAEENVHDHRWTFASTVLTGALEHDLFHDVAPGRGLRFDEWRYVRDAHSAQKHALGPAWVERHSRHFVSAGQSYWLRASHLHRIRWSSPGTSTLVATWAAERADNRLLSSTEVVPTTSIEQLSAEALAASLDRYLITTAPSGRTR